MNLLAPAALGLGLLAIPIVAMYILKMRRPPRPVPSTFLWEQVLDDAQANAPWQRLRRNLLLLLQLLALAALVLALARPYTLRAATAQGDVVAVLDASYLTRATDGAPSRFAEAKRRVGALIDGLGPDRVMSIVLMARRPRVLIAQSADHAALHAALDGAAPTYETPDPAAALGVASALSRTSHSSVFVYMAAGDPAVAIPDALRGVTTVQSVGGPLRDLGVAALAAARATDGTISMLTRVANYGARATTLDLRLDITTDGGVNPAWRQVDLRPLTLAPGASTVITRAILPPNTTAVRARLANGDDLAADDVAWAAVPAAPSRRVLLVTPGDIYLSGAFGILPGVRVDEITPDAYTAARARCVDTAIFEQTLPATLPPASVPIFAVYPPTTPAAATTPVTATTPTTNTTAIPVGTSLDLTVGSATSANGLQAGEDPYRLLQDVALNGVAVGSVRPLVTPPWGYAVLRTNGLPVLVAGQNGARREAVLGFEPSDSTWGGSVGFPIAMQNLLDWLAPSTTATNGVYRPGDPVALPTLACATNTTVTDPTGAKTSVSTLPLAGASATSAAASTDTTGAAAPLFTDTNAPGLYSVEQTVPGGVQRGLFAVNLFPLSQASNAPAATGGGSSAPAASAKQTRVPVEWAPLAAALALLALCYEWFVAARRR